MKWYEIFFYWGWGLSLGLYCGYVLGFIKGKYKDV
jgi:hypothetical protein